jgi:O-antigen ligase
MAPNKPFNTLRQLHFTEINQKKYQSLLIVFLALLVGSATGTLALVANNASSKWAGVIVIAILAPSAVLLINNIKKLILVTLVVDLILGIDIAIQNQGWHRGGPTGYMMSLATISLGIGYALWFIEKKPKPKFFPTISIPAVIYLGTILLSFYQSPNWLLSSFELFLGLQALLIYFYLVNHLSTWADVKLILFTITVCVLFEGLLMTLQYFAGASINLGGLIVSDSLANGGQGVIGDRVAGTLARPGNAALYLNSMLPLILGSYLIEGLINKKLALITFCVGVVALIATSSRAGWIGFGVAMLIFMAQVIWAGFEGKIIPLFLAGGLLIGIFFGGVIQQRLATIEEDHTRDQLDFMAYNIIRAYPLGVGANTYDLYMSDQFAHPVWVGHKHEPVHNKYLLTWAQLGLQGLMAFILSLVATIWQARRWFLNNKVDRRLAVLPAGLLAGLIAQMIQMRSETFNSGFHANLLWLVIALIVAMGYLVTSSPTGLNDKVTA